MRLRPFRTDQVQLQHRCRHRGDDTDPLCFELCDAHAALGCKIPTNLPRYDGEMDLKEHLVQFKCVVQVYNINDDFAAKLFVTPMQGVASSWYIRQPSASIESFDDLCQKFVNHVHPQTLAKLPPGHLHKIKQIEGGNPREEIPDLKSQLRRCQQRAAVLGGGGPHSHRRPSPSTAGNRGMAKITRGLLHEVLLKQLLLFCSLSSCIDANLHYKMLEREATSPGTVLMDAPAMPELPLPANLPLFHKPHRNHLSPYGAPAQPRNYGHFEISAPPSWTRLPKPSMSKSGSVPASASRSPPRLSAIAPAQPDPSTITTGLAQPPLSPSISDCCGPDMVLKRESQGCHCVYPIKLDILLLNVSSNPNWTLFLEQFATQLGLGVSQIELINFYMVGISGLNISMDITPHTGISFSASEAARINSSLSMHKVHLDPALVGGYQLLNITWFKPPLLPQAPVSAKSPMEAHPNLPSTPAAVVTSKKVKRPSLVLVIGLGAIILIVAVISVIVICFCVYRQGKHIEPLKETVAKQRTVETIPVIGSLRHPTSTRFLTYEELKEATNNFEPASILGEGGFGRVFKGVLSDGTPVAIKRLSSGGQQGDKEFLVEVEMLSRLHHRNLVKLVGYYSNRDSSQNLLCYELVPNGSLEAWLHGPLGLNCPLDWDTRMKIALDAARGLAYLHEDSQPCVIHRDFKASNILLENNFHAKVSDFGLAKQAPEGRANYLSTRVMGTFGYVAPEYAMTGHLLVKSDVYSYGVVLLELLTGRKPVDMSQPSGQENLVTWARPILRDKDRLEELADPRLVGKYPKEDFFRVCTIAAACVAPEASQRPTMGEVVQSLKMVQRVTENHDSAVPSNTGPNRRQSSTTFESDTSSMFSSGPYSGLSAFDNENISRTVVFSEDLQEGR